MRDADASALPATLRGFAVASHLGPTVLVTALSIGLLIGLAAPLPTVLLAGAAVLAGQLSVGWSNDWFDAERDAAVARTGKPVVAGVLTRRQLAVGAVVAAVVCAILSWSTGVVPGTVHVIAVASAWAYNRRLKGTVLSPVPYVVSFALLPTFLVLAIGGAVPVWLWLTGGLLGAGAHLANALPDLEDDVVTGVSGLPHRVGRTASAVLAPALLVAAASVVAFASPGPVDAVRVTGVGVATVLAIGAGTAGLARPRSRLPFTLSMAVAVVCVILLVGAGPRIVAA